MSTRLAEISSPASSIRSENAINDLVNTEQDARAALRLGQMLSIRGAEMFHLEVERTMQHVKSALPTMAHGRLKPPPDETYSLHRKLSEVFCHALASALLCAIVMLFEFVGAP